MEPMSKPTMREQLLETEVRSWPDEARKHYRKLRKSGNSIVMAHMLAAKQAPQLHGDNDQAFTKTYRDKMENMPAWRRDWMISQAKKNGVAVDGKFKIPGLPPSSPDAWCTSSQDAKSIYKKHNLAAEGIVNNTPVGDPVSPDEVKPRLASDIVDKIVQEKIDADPAIQEKVTRSPKAINELKEQVVAEHGRPERRVPV